MSKAKLLAAIIAFMTALTVSTILQAGPPPPLPKKFFGLWCGALEGVANHRIKSESQCPHQGVTKVDAGGFNGPHERCNVKGMLVDASIPDNILVLLQCWSTEHNGSDKPWYNYVRMTLLDGM